jgi:hypothetical protein
MSIFYQPFLLFLDIMKFNLHLSSHRTLLAMKLRICQRNCGEMRSWIDHVIHSPFIQVLIHGPCCSAHSKTKNPGFKYLRTPIKLCIPFSKYPSIKKSSSTIKSCRQLFKALCVYTNCPNHRQPTCNCSSSAIISKSWKVIFVLGGPGSGKTNQC